MESAEAGQSLYDEDIESNNPDYDTSSTSIEVEDTKEYSSHRPVSRRAKIIAHIIAALLSIAIVILVLVSIVNFSQRPPLPRAPLHKNLTEIYKNAAPTVVEAMDRTVDPCTDFYAYVCNGWKKKNPIPADRQSWVKSFSITSEKNSELLKRIMQENWPVIGVMYSNCMDTAKIDEVGISPLHNVFFEIDRLTQMPVRKSDLAKLVAQIHQIGVSIVFGSSADIDIMDPDQVVLGLYQAGLTLPTPEQYKENTESDLWGRYKSYIAAMLEEISHMDGSDTYAAAAERVFEFEQNLANHTLSRAALRDPSVYYNPMSLGDLLNLTGNNFAWTAYFQELGISDVAYSRVVVQSLPFMENLKHVFDFRTPQQLITFRYYMKFKIAHAYANLLTSNISNIAFEFRKFLYNVTDRPERSKWCTDLVSSQLSDIVSRYFVMHAFSESARDKAREMIVLIEKQFEKMFESASWMDDETQQRAKQKLHSINNKVGYPTNWTDYGEVYIKPDSFLENVIELAKFRSAKEFAALEKPADRSQWLMDSFEVNAYFFAPWNEIVFPAGILQPPFFSDKYPDAMNFGGIGAVVGHEISHAFDDKGRQFDSTGRLTQWWSDDAITAFKSKADCVRNLYDSYTLENGTIKVDGSLTLGENIADAGGVKAAFMAFKEHQMKKTASQLRHENQLVREYFELDNADQLFFVSYGQVWCANERSSYQKIKVSTDPHSPYQFRTNGPLSNYDEFSRVFKCPANAPMNPSKKCVVW